MGKITYYLNSVVVDLSDKWDLVPGLKEVGKNNKLQISALFFNVDGSKFSVDRGELAGLGKDTAVKEFKSLELESLSNDSPKTPVVYLNVFEIPENDSNDDDDINLSNYLTEFGETLLDIKSGASYNIYNVGENRMLSFSTPTRLNRSDYKRLTGTVRFIRKGKFYIQIIHPLCLSENAALELTSSITVDPNAKTVSQNGHVLYELLGYKKTRNV